MAKKFEKELKDLGAKTPKQLMDIFRTSKVYSTEKLELLYLNVRDNIIGRYSNLLKDIEVVSPEKIEGIIQESKRTNPNINTINDLIDSAYDYLNYYHAIKTEEQLRYEFERASKFVYYQGIDIPIVIEFDYQYYSRDYIYGNKPTFYSYANTKTITKFGNGAYHIAFPSSQGLLTDDEVMVAMKHEFGHIFQGHTTTRFRDDEQFEINNSNQAMDISINIGMTPKEQQLLFDVIRKITKNNEACPCLSLSKPRGQGGYGIPQISSPTEWKRNLGFIKAYYMKQNDEKKNEEESQGGEGSGQGSGSSQPSQPQQQDDKIKVGDYVSIDGSYPKKYGKVVSINNDGKYVVDEISDEEWKNIKKSYQ